jgi:hypothetical protein
VSQKCIQRCDLGILSSLFAELLNTFLDQPPLIAGPEATPLNHLLKAAEPLMVKELQRQSNRSHQLAGDGLTVLRGKPTAPFEQILKDVVDIAFPWDRANFAERPGVYDGSSLNDVKRDFFAVGAQKGEKLNAPESTGRVDG